MDDVGIHPLSSFLQWLLDRCGSSSEKKAALRKSILRYCRILATHTACVQIYSENISAMGGCYSVAVVLTAMDAAANNAFPLLERWEYFAKPMFDICIGKRKGVIGDESRDSISCRSAIEKVLECAVSMLRGVVNSSAVGNTIMTLGPSEDIAGGRSRSYSISDETTTIMNPYPEDMASTIEECLMKQAKSIFLPSTSNPPFLCFLCYQTIELVVGRSAWAENVFPHLSERYRRSTAFALLALRTCDNDRSDSGHACKDADTHKDFVNDQVMENDLSFI